MSMRRRSLRRPPLQAAAAAAAAGGGSDGNVAPVLVQSTDDGGAVAGTRAAEARSTDDGAASSAAAAGGAPASHHRPPRRFVPPPPMADGGDDGGQGADAHGHAAAASPPRLLPSPRAVSAAFNLFCDGPTQTIGIGELELVLKPLGIHRTQREIDALCARSGVARTRLRLEDVASVLTEIAAAEHARRPAANPDWARGRGDALVGATIGGRAR